MIDKELNVIQIKFREMEEQLKLYKKLEQIRSVDELSESIRKERRKQHLTLKDLAELSGISYGTLVKLEGGEEGISLKNLKQVLRTLGMGLWTG
ncbi:MAG: helix-turn-helix transcriptional regulator [Spirochaetales bacterium]|nr:helix-turn-helix transcriptional regulator [Spirochaetales bacterium]